jgi:hypothetical protein
MSTPPSFHWRLDVCQAAFVQTDHHIDDLVVLHRSFAEWLGGGRLELHPGIVVRAFAASEEEARRFEAEAREVIRERDLFLVTSLHTRPDDASPWREIEISEPPPSDAEIEAELGRFLEDDT